MIEPSQRGRSSGQTNNTQYNHKMICVNYDRCFKMLYIWSHQIIFIINCKSYKILYDHRVFARGVGGALCGFMGAFTKHNFLTI